MPAYPGNGLAQLIEDNRQVFLWQAETPPVAATNGSLSIAFQLQRIPGAFYPWGFAVEAQFSAAPGTFEIDVMGAETDASANYVKIGSITAVNSANVGRFESTTLFPKYVAVYLTTLTNTGASVTVKLTH